MKKRNNILRYFLLFLFLFQCNSSKNIQREPTNAITIYQKNPHYFAYKGEPVLLLGGSDEDNLFNNPDLMIRNLETLEQIGGNYIRCTMSSRDVSNVWAFERNNDGTYDLEKPNTIYWQRFENCLREAAKRKIIVQIEIWATFDFYRDNWLKNPFNPGKNINYLTENTNLVTEWPHHPARKPQPFFYSIPEKNNDINLLNYQHKFVDNLMDISLQYDNVLYCLDNETRAPAEWAWYWARYLLDRAHRESKSILLTEMWDAHDLRNKEHKQTYQHPDLFAFFDISQNNWQEGQKHYDNGLWIRGKVKKCGGIRPLTNIKVYHRRSGGLPNEPRIGLDRWWQNIFIGCASTRFHRPMGGTGLSDMSQKAIKAARLFTNEFNIFSCEPHPDLLSKKEENKAYCLADPGNVYALYFPNGGNVNLKIHNSKLSMKMRWFNPATGTFLESQPVQDKHKVTLTSPDTNQSWLVLLQKS